MYELSSVGRENERVRQRERYWESGVSRCLNWQLAFWRLDTLYNAHCPNQRFVRSLQPSYLTGVCEWQQWLLWIAHIQSEDVVKWVFALFLDSWILFHLCLQFLILFQAIFFQNSVNFDKINNFLSRISKFFILLLYQKLTRELTIKYKAVIVLSNSTSITGLILIFHQIIRGSLIAYRRFVRCSHKNTPFIYLGFIWNLRKGFSFQIKRQFNQMRR